VSFLVTRSRAIAPALALIGLFAAPLPAAAQADKDIKAITAYTFTMPKYKQLLAAYIHLGKAAQRDAGLGRAMEGSGDLSLDQMVARYDAIPAARKAIGDAGMTTREFAVAQGAMIQVGMSYGMMKEYKLSADSVSKATGVSKANLEFWRTNEAELERLNQEFQAQMPKDEADAEASEDTTE
jgi:hypothetical protein